MLQKALSFFALRYCLVGIIPATANIIAFNLLLLTGLSSGISTGIAFMIGGQVSFWSHDRLTFRHLYKHVAGWQMRLAKFIPGQGVGATATFVVGGLLGELTGTPARMVYLLATAAGIGSTVTWNILVTWAKKNAKHPATPASPIKE